MTERLGYDTRSGYRIKKVMVEVELPYFKEFLYTGEYRPPVPGEIYLNGYAQVQCGIHGAGIFPHFILIEYEDDEQEVAKNESNN